MIPDWNISGLIPPIRPNQLGHSPDRSPYRISLMDVINKFSHTLERQKILKGFLDYRQQLHGIGLTEGFQWLDGSFMENVEILRGRPPKDIDVVTFYVMPNGMTQTDLATNHMDIFDQPSVKTQYLVDAYSIELSGQVNNQVDSWYVQQITYWYSMWSHTRQEQWKGFLEIDLSPLEDANALALLENIINEGGAI